MEQSLKNRNFLKLLDYTPAEIRYLLDLARTDQHPHALRL